MKKLKHWNEFIEQIFSSSLKEKYMTQEEYDKILNMTYKEVFSLPRARQRARESVDYTFLKWLNLNNYKLELEE